MIWQFVYKIDCRFYEVRAKYGESKPLHVLYNTEDGSGQSGNCDALRLYLSLYLGQPDLYSYSGCPQSLIHSDIIKLNFAVYRRAFLPQRQKAFLRV
jgi:hypothetical protein